MDKTLTVSDLPVLGAWKVLDAKTKRTLHERTPSEPGDIAPLVAIRNVVAVYAANDVLVVEVE
jgi:hypothetical protein